MFTNLPKRIVAAAFYMLTCVALTACSGGGTAQQQAPNYSASTSQSTSSTGAGAATIFSLTSTAVQEGGAMPSAFTCDGAKLSLPVAWKGAPASTKSFVLLMTTLPGDGTTKWNWVLYNIPADQNRLILNTTGVGVLGAADDGAGNAYAPPCSQGPGNKTYTFTLYALSDVLSFSTPPSQITGRVVTDALKTLTLGTAVLNVTYARTTPQILSGPVANCALIQNSTAPWAASVNVDCSKQDYALISSQGIPNHAMMNGITATNLQVPTGQSFTGTRAWRIPLAPSIALSPTSVVDGPIGIAVNGVPIFNPCKQGGCQNGDTKALGELDICNGHAGRADDYHYHAAPNCLMAEAPGNYWDTHPLGWALDGFAIFGFNSSDGSVATRDTICGGTSSTIASAPTGYAYHVTNAAPYVTNCLRGVPSPDLAQQSTKYSPMRQPPVTPFAVSGMTLSNDPADGYNVLQFTSAISFTTTETGSDTYANAPGTYKIRYKEVTGTALTALLAQQKNAGKTACWNFQFTNSSGATTQPTMDYCR